MAALICSPILRIITAADPAVHDDLQCWVQDAVQKRASAGATKSSATHLCPASGAGRKRPLA